MHGSSRGGVRGSLGRAGDEGRTGPQAEAQGSAQAEAKAKAQEEGRQEAREEGCPKAPNRRSACQKGGSKGQTGQEASDDAEEATLAAPLTHLEAGEILDGGGSDRLTPVLSRAPGPLERLLY